MAHGRGLRGADLAFALGFGLYAAGGLAVLAQGLLAVAASASPGLHESLHTIGLGYGLSARIALRAADASHAVPSATQIVLDHVFSVVHLAMAGVLLWLRPRDWAARLLAVALVGAAGPGSGSQLLFANLVDFDMLYGHRRDPEGYALALEEFLRRRETRRLQASIDEAFGDGPDPEEQAAMRFMLRQHVRRTKDIW
jgi:hypothetical protein